MSLSLVSALPISAAFSGTGVTVGLKEVCIRIVGWKWGRLLLRHQQKVLESLTEAEAGRSQKNQGGL